MTYNVFGGTLNFAQSINSIWVHLWRYLTYKQWTA